ncbi:MAG TPA: hypothetical protein VMU77_00785 [Acidimicrobiales bacterium]|nr:hypothetical protein [Acidimicrobiales bacterium]
MRSVRTERLDPPKQRTLVSRLSRRMLVIGQTDVARTEYVVGTDSVG